MAESTKDLAVKDATAELKSRQAELASIQNQKVLDTPRTREACHRLGLVLEDLQFRPFDSFSIPGDMREKQQMRFEHYEKRRKDRLANVLAERAKVIGENARKGETPGVQSGQFLSMLESLFEKEAKRLEIDLKGQLRSHSAMVKDNEEQLLKEEKYREKLAKVEEKRKKAEEKTKETAEKVRTSLETQLDKSREKLDELQKKYEKEQIEAAKKIEAEEERLLRLQQAKAKESSDKSAVFRERVEQMKAKNREAIVERQKEAEKSLQRIQERIAAVAANREEEMKHRQLKSEEQHLHIMDVRDTKNRIERVEMHRRKDLREQIESNVERIETLLALKDQLLDQRKGRNTKAESTRGSKGLNLKRDCLPGPGQYEMPPSCLQELPAPRIGKSVVPGMLDVAIQGTKANPAPGSYDNRLLPNGQSASLGGMAQGAFGKNPRPSFLVDAAKAKADIPAPGTYDSKQLDESRAVKMSRNRLSDQGLDKFSAKRFPVWARPGTDTPGPAGYNVDEYLRKEVVRKVHKSLPNLTKDMLRPAAPAASR